MSLDATSLALAIKTAIIAAVPCKDPAGITAWDGVATAIAVAVVAHLKTAAVVAPTSLVAPAGGGPVTGFGSIT